MKLLLVSSSSGSRGGGELYLTNLGAALAARGHDVTYWMSNHSRMDELAAIASGSGKVIRADYRNTYDLRFRSLATLWNYSVSRRIAATWQGYDLIHLNKQNLEDGLDLLRAARFSGVPAVCMIHMTQSAKYLAARNAGIRDWVSRRELRLHNGPFVAVQERRAAELRAVVGNKPVETILAGVAVPEHASELRCAPLHVVGVGRLVPQKRPLLFAEYASLIQARYPDCKVTWVGDGSLAGEWDREVAARRLRAVRTGWQPDVAPYLQQADVFLHTAGYEGLPLAVLEAMGAGLPCLVSPDLLDEMPLLRCLVIPLDSEGTWLDKIADPQRLRRIGGEARAFIQRECTFSRMAERYEALYRSLLANFSP